MVTNPADIHRGMEVFAVDGELIGTVIDVHAPEVLNDFSGTSGASPSGSAPQSGGSRPSVAPGSGGEDALRGYGARDDQGGVPQTSGARAEQLENLRGRGGGDPNLHATPHRLAGAIEVEDRGVMGIGAGGLRIPFSAVLDVMPGRRVTLDCTRRQAHERYGPGPSMRIDENAPVTPPT
ncbi:MAG: hypothetical protein AB7R89_34630 [Dehalococcoidia bacterium]